MSDFDISDLLAYDYSLTVSGTGWDQQVNDAMASIIANFRHGVLERTLAVEITNPAAGSPIITVPPGYQAIVEQVWLVNGDSLGTGLDIQIGTEAEACTDWHSGTGTAIATIANSNTVVILEPKPRHRDSNEALLTLLLDGDTADNALRIRSESVSNPGGSADIWVLGTVWKK